MFEENIREYLGTNPINNGIIKSLKDKTDRNNFFYYNNGITIICKGVENTHRGNELTLVRPQIVNGCQTVNSICEVLDHYTPEQILLEIKGVFVLTKILLVEIAKPHFYKDIVKFTNKQNAIKETAFASTHTVFERLQNEFKERGFLLLVKPSDKNKFTLTLSTDFEANQLLGKANRFANRINIELTTLKQLYIPLDKLLQVCLAFIESGQAAFVKKALLLKQSSDTYTNFSLKINDFLTTDNLIRLYLIYFKAEQKRKESEDGKTPLPYYVVGFLGDIMKGKEINEVIKSIFDKVEELFKPVFNYLELLSEEYRTGFKEKYKEVGEYNDMVNKEIDKEILTNKMLLLNRILVKNNEILSNFFDTSRNLSS